MQKAEGCEGLMKLEVSCIVDFIAFASSHVALDGAQQTGWVNRRGEHWQ